MADGSWHPAERNGIAPGGARCVGYSLAKMAEVTAVFNSGSHTGLPPVAPIQMLETGRQGDQSTTKCLRGRNNDY
jgi:hypothetical protein